MVIIKELEIKNCLSMSHVSLRFERNNYATIFNCASSSKLKNKLLYAIKAFFCKDMVSLRMKDKGNNELKSSYTRIKFLMRRIEGEGNDVIDAMQVSAKPNQILYYFNDEQFVEPIELFHERCQIDVSSVYLFLNEMFPIKNTHLMEEELVLSNNVTTISLKLLADYLESPPSHSPIQRIAELSQITLLTDKECIFIKKRTFLIVANEIARIFKYITFEEYSVKFSIPLCGEHLEAQELKWEDFNLNKISIRIKKIGVHDHCEWSQLEPGLRNIMEISRKIAVTKCLNQKLIFIEDTTLLQEYQNQEMVKEAIIQKSEVNAKSEWEKKNFIKRIADVCNAMEISIFMNYHGLLMLPSTTANIIKCRDFEKADSQSVYVSSNSQHVSLDDFILLFSVPCS